MNEHIHVIELRRLVARTGRRSNGKALAVGHGGPPARWWRNLAAGEPDIPTLTLDEHPHSTSTLTHLQVGNRDASRPLATESHRAEELRRGTAAAENENATLPRRDWLRGVDGEVAGFKAELWTRFCGRQCGGEHARVRRSGGGSCARLFRPVEGRTEGRGRCGASEAETVVVAALKAW
jgi:hypothetical protein